MVVVYRQLGVFCPHVSLKGGEFQGFDTTWDQAPSASEAPKEKLESCVQDENM